MDSFNKSIIKDAISQHAYDALSEMISVIYSEKPKVFITEYDGDHVRLISNGDNINVICPNNISVVQESALEKAIETGTIFDDAEEVNNTTKYIELTSLPHRSICNKGLKYPKSIHFTLTGILNVLDDSGKFKISDSSVTNANHCMNDILTSGHTIKTIADNYIGDKEFDSLHKSLKDEILKIDNEIASIKDVDLDDMLTDHDYEELEFEDDTKPKDDSVYEESFFTKKPKKLKPIPRDIIPYITVELNNIQDANDQAMLSGYTCSKLELVDFYLNVLDTNDARYIVPHTKNYLVQMQNDLNKLLAQILKIKPINRNDRVWQVNVNYPEGWRG